MEMDPKSSSPQKQGVKGRSKSTEEIQQAKKAFHTPQKSLPSTGEEGNVQHVPKESGDTTEQHSSKEQTQEDQSHH
ncbi:hypothetical protein FKM82_012358 [Ascaphus truei]